MCEMKTLDEIKEKILDIRGAFGYDELFVIGFKLCPDNMTKKEIQLLSIKALQSCIREERVKYSTVDRKFYSMEFVNRLASEGIFVR